MNEWDERRRTAEGTGPRLATPHYAPEKVLRCLDSNWVTNRQIALWQSNRN